MFKKFFILFLLVIAVSTCAWADSFDEFWQFPKVELSPTTAKKYSRNFNGKKMVVEEVFYQSNVYKGKPVRIFGYFCYPKYGKKPLPGLLISHGGGGGANLKNTLVWASRGYATLTIDLPGKGTQRQASRSSGPDMTVPVLLRVTPDPTYNYLYQAVMATRSGISYLESRKEVDPEKLGMVGVSWGGVLTLLTNGLDDRLKTAVNVFGSGYIAEASTWQNRFDKMNRDHKNFWDDHFDPKNVLGKQSGSILFLTGTNDHCYYLPTFLKSYQKVKAPKKLTLIPNLKHKFMPKTQKIVMRWLDSKLKLNTSFPEVKVLEPYQKGADKMIIPISVKTTKKIRKVKIYLSKSGPDKWTIKKWGGINVTYKEGNIYYGAIPTRAIDPEVTFYVSVEDSMKAVTSSPVYSLFKAKNKEKHMAYVMSSPITQSFSHPAPYFSTDLRFKNIAGLIFSKKDNSFIIR